MVACRPRFDVRSNARSRRPPRVRSSRARAQFRRASQADIRCSSSHGSSEFSLENAGPFQTCDENAKFETETARSIGKCLIGRYRSPHFWRTRSREICRALHQSHRVVAADCDSICRALAGYSVSPQRQRTPRRHRAALRARLSSASPRNAGRALRSALGESERSCTGSRTVLEHRRGASTDRERARRGRVRRLRRRR